MYSPQMRRSASKAKSWVCPSRSGSNFPGGVGRGVGLGGGGVGRGVGLGAAVGGGVGAAVGDGVGAVGDAVGAAVGGVGDAVGAAVGAAVAHVTPGMHDTVQFDERIVLPVPTNTMVQLIFFCIILLVVLASDGTPNGESNTSPWSP